MLSDESIRVSDLEVWVPDASGVLALSTNLLYDDAPWLTKKVCLLYTTPSTRYFAVLCCVVRCSGARYYVAYCAVLLCVLRRAAPFYVIYCCAVFRTVPTSSITCCGRVALPVSIPCTQSLPSLALRVGVRQEGLKTAPQRNG